MLESEKKSSAIFKYFALNDNGTVSPSILWDAGKATIRGKIISIGTRLKKDRLKKQVELEAEIKRLEREHKQYGKQEVLDKLKENRTKLDEILTYKAEGALRFIDINITNWEIRTAGYYHFNYRRHKRVI